MKVVCISNQRENVEIEFPKYSYDYLTIGKAYEVIPTMRSGTLQLDDWLIRDDSANASWYAKNLFVTLEEYRQKQLEQLI